VAGRALAFSDPEIVRMAKEDFVPVACDDWYQRRRKDAEGEFWRKVSDGAEHGPGHLTDMGADGGGTRQGIYMLTADGTLLARKNAGQDPNVMRDVLREALAKWKRLPGDRRRPGAVQVPADPGPLDGGYTRKPPKSGLIVNVYTRLLDRDEKGELCDAVCKIGDGNEAARDHLWLTESEWRSLVPKDARGGQTLDLPAAIARRIARFHLVDNTRGEPPMWQAADVRSLRMTLTVESADAKAVKLRLDGTTLLATAADPEKARRGYDAGLLGYVEYDRAADRLTRFDIVTTGDHWGEGPFTGGARPGRKPMGVVFELAHGGKPADAVPPQAAREEAVYFGRER
jgi:hypothetical protein